MDNLSITSYNLNEPWIGTAQVCIDQAQYNSLGIQMAIGVGFAFLVGWMLGYYFNSLGGKNGSR